MIQVEGVSKHFGGFTAIHGCSLSVPQGSIVGLIGPNGAGKTTLFNIIGGALKPSAGTVRLNGRDVTGARPHALVRHGLVRTFQIPQEFSTMSALENLMVVPEGQLGANLAAAWALWAKVRAQEATIRQRAESVLAFLGLAHVAHERAGSLSGGQKKLLELGRALMSGAKTVLLDEPAAGVNRTLLNTLRSQLAELRAAHGYTFFVIEHDMNFVDALCDSVICMAHGEVLARGTMQDIRDDKRVLEAYLGARHANPASARVQP